MLTFFFGFFFPEKSSGRCESQEAESSRSCEEKEAETEGTCRASRHPSRSLSRRKWDSLFLTNTRNSFSHKTQEKEEKLKKKMLTKGGKKKKERDPDAPKRARTAFNFFLDSFREDYKREHPEAKGMYRRTFAQSRHL